MSWKDWSRVYFIGIGGIGMSALARFLNQQGVEVQGYDRMETSLTRNLVKEGIQVWYKEDAERVSGSWDAVIYTPAIPKDHAEMKAVSPEVLLLKRSELLGQISKTYRLWAVAGTHGKTTTSTLLAHTLVQLNEDPLAILGGIYSGWNSNLYHGKSDLMVTEADEFDRSFLQLKPQWSILNSIDPDHLDIYGTPEEMEKTYLQYLQGHDSKGGILIFDKAFDKLKHRWSSQTRLLTFGENEGSDYRLLEVGSSEEGHWMRWSVQDKERKHLVPMPGKHNALNALATLAILDQNGLDVEAGMEALKSFQGISRRFETRYRKKGVIIIDDYAHHPTEVNAAIQTARSLYPNHQLHVVFQAHLYSRTEDFMDGFAEALSEADVFYSCELYPAREKPIPGVTGQALFNKVKADLKFFSKKEEIVRNIEISEKSVILVLGAGNIDSIITDIIKKIGKED